MDRLNELINEFVVEVADKNTTSNYWLEKRVELETLIAQKKAHNSDYTKCLEDLYENYPYKEEWDKADIAEFIEKHFA